MQLNHLLINCEAIITIFNTGNRTLVTLTKLRKTRSKLDFADSILLLVWGGEQEAETM